MDAVWKILSKYIPSIFIASICNEGISLGFAFCLSECKKFYKSFYKVFNDVIQFNLLMYVIKSNGIIALKAVVCDYLTHHLKYHDHFLRSLKATELNHQTTRFMQM